MTSHRNDFERTRVAGIPQAEVKTRVNRALGAENVCCVSGKTPSMCLDQPRVLQVLTDFAFSSLPPSRSAPHVLPEVQLAVSYAT